MKQNEINRRLEKISLSLIQGRSETQIAKELGVSRSTIVRNVSKLKKMSQVWLDGLPKGTFIYEYKLALDKIKYIGSEFSNQYEKATKLQEKIQILKECEENAKLYIQLLAEAPAICAFKKAVKSEKKTNVSKS